MYKSLDWVRLDLCRQFSDAGGIKATIGKGVVVMEYQYQAGYARVMETV